MAYKEWIKFGRDPVLPAHFWALNRAEARSFYDKVIASIPERVGQLQDLIHEHRPESQWKPDFTESAFAVVVDVFTECVATRPRTPEEVERHIESQPEIIKTLGEDVRNWEGTDRTYSIAFDAGIYWALDLQSKERRFQWELCGGKTMYLRNQPILRASCAKPSRRVTPLVIGPLDEFGVDVLRVADRNPHRFTWIDIYREWVRLIREFQEDCPGQT